jgi:hypothetical protein
VPDNVFAALRPSSWQDKLVHCLLDSQAVRSRQGSQLIANLLHLALSDGFWDALHMLLGWAFPASTWLEDRYGLRKGIATKLMTLIHPILVLMQVLGSCSRKSQRAERPTEREEKG